jgi:G3E family GTPase
MYAGRVKTAIFLTLGFLAKARSRSAIPFQDICVEQGNHVTTPNLSEHRKIPVTVLTGFLGSGKTTVLSGLVRHQALRRTAVIINEFGEIGLDHELVQKSEENFILVRNGCVCCTVRGDLVSTLQDLTDRQRLRDIGTLDRVVIETTGLADPAPILHTLMNDRSLLSDYGLGAVVATIDAVNGLDTLDQHQEAVKQIGIADLLLLTKTDLASPEEVSALRDRIAAINPGAKIVRTIGGNIDPADFFASGLYRLEGKTADVQNWLRAESYDDVVRAHAHHGKHETSDVNRHDDRIRAYCVTREQPISWAGLSRWLDLIIGMRGNDLLRVKGIVKVLEHPSQPMVIHGVQHLFHPPIQLSEWPSDDHRTRIVFITRDIDQDVIEDTLRVFEHRQKKS